MRAPYFADDYTTLYHGDMREVVPQLGLQADLVVADPPYGETSLRWDRWPEGWLGVIADAADSMWCFGSMRMFLRRNAEFDRYWNLSQDVVWQKNTGSSLVADRFRRVHEHALHWYRGAWNLVHHETPRVAHDGPNWGRRRHGVSKAQHFGGVRQNTWEDDGTRLVTSVVQAQNLRGKAIHPTEKPVPLLDLLIRYACPPGGTVLDPFAGSGSTAAAARMSGRRSVLIEGDERYCEAIARRLQQGLLEVQTPNGTVTAEPGDTINRHHDGGLIVRSPDGLDRAGDKPPADDLEAIKPRATGGIVYGGGPITGVDIHYHDGPGPNPAGLAQDAHRRRPGYSHGAA